MPEIERETASYDVVIVGAGPAGLSAAIRSKQIDPDVTVVVLEKGSEVGAHILSGAVLDPSGLDALLPEWRQMGPPTMVPVTEDSLYVLGSRGRLRVPHLVMPPLMDNRGNLIVSLGRLCKWLAEIAEGMGVDIFPGMAASALDYDEDGRVAGVVAGEFGRNGDGSPGPRYEPGMRLEGKYLFLGEGARGSLSKEITGKFDLSRGREPQKFGIGFKEIWEVDPKRHAEGAIVHTLGWPLGNNAGGGSFIYHGPDNQIFLGFVVHLDYENPHIDPYCEFQRFKHHPSVSPLLDGGRRIAYGARVISEGGYHSIPRTVFPGGALIGCAAGLVNVPRIKGIHNAMLSGKAAAEAAVAALQAGRARDELEDYERQLRDGPVGKDLKRVRNVKPLWKRFGMIGGLGLGGLEMWAQTLLGRGLFGTLGHKRTDADETGKAAGFTAPDYPRPDGIISFDRTTNVAYSFTNHEECQPSHLRLADPALPVAVNLPVYGEPAQRYCPAGVYEVLVDDASRPRFQINFQNCVHCKTCDIKDPSHNITWTTPEGGGGPNYPNM